MVSCSKSRRGCGLVGLGVVGISFGYIEAAVVVYLRGYYEPLHRRLYPERAAGDLLPLISLDAYETTEDPPRTWAATGCVDCVSPRSC